jgi:hypothetical protein
MQTTGALLIEITDDGVSPESEAAQSLTIFMVKGLKTFCQYQQLSNWCWAASSLTVQNYFSLQNRTMVSTQSDICVLALDKVVNNGGSFAYFLQNKLNYKNPNIIPSKSTTTNVTFTALLQFMDDSVTQGAPMILADNTRGSTIGHAVVILGYGVPANVAASEYTASNCVIVYFDPYLGTYNKGNPVYLYAPFTNFLPDISTGLDSLYAYPPQINPYFMVPLLNQIPKDASWNYPGWHVSNGVCSVPYTVPKNITSGGITYATPNSGIKNVADLYYYPRMTRDNNPLSENTYFASSVKMERQGHSFKTTFQYGISFNDPHSDMVVTGCSYDASLGTQVDDFYLWLIPMSKTLLKS